MKFKLEIEGEGLDLFHTLMARMALHVSDPPATHVQVPTSEPAPPSESPPIPALERYKSGDRTVPGDAELDRLTASDDAPTHDADGVPWDERWHASSRARVQSGQWRMRKNMTDADKAAYQDWRAEIVSPPPPPHETAAPPPPPPPPHEGGVQTLRPSERFFRATRALHAGQGLEAASREVDGLLARHGYHGIPDALRDARGLPSVCEALESLNPADPVRRAEALQTWGLVDE